jgi:hypothetical protein
VTDRFLAWAKPRTVFGALGNAASTIVVVLAFAAVVVFVVTLVSGPFRWQVAGVTVFRNTDVWRPLQFAVVAALIAGHPALSPRVLALVVLVCLLPFIPYQRTLATLSVDRHPLRSARECLIAVRDAERAAGRPGPGILAVMPDKWLLHSYYYYFRHVTPFERAHEVDPKALSASLSTEGHYRPVLIDDADYQAFKARHPMVDRAMPIIGLPHVLLLLPGPYRVCGPSEPR